MKGKRSLANNIVGEKNVRKKTIIVNLLSRGSMNGDGNTTEKSSSGKKNKNKSYILRPCYILKWLETVHRTKLPRKRCSKPRPKTAPMSKYRRNMANLRERRRMGEINVYRRKYQITSLFLSLLLRYYDLCSVLGINK